MKRFRVLLLGVVLLAVGCVASSAGRRAQVAGAVDLVSCVAGGAGAALEARELVERARATGNFSALAGVAPALLPTVACLVRDIALIASQASTEGGTVPRSDREVIEARAQACSAERCKLEEAAARWLVEMRDRGRVKL